MPKVRFTEVLDERYGGTYQTGVYTVREVGTIIDLSPSEVSRLNRDHPGLIEDASDDEAKDDEDEQVTKDVTEGKDREVRGGKRKSAKRKKR
jgi:hypothetical protein